MAGFNHWSKIAANITPAIEKIVSNTARKGEANVKGQIQANGQVRTGFMLSSVYSVTKEGSTYGQIGTPPKDASLLPEVGPADSTTAYFAVAASYAQFPNYGTKFQAANPFFEPAVEQTRTDFETELSQFEGLIGKIS